MASPAINLTPEETQQTIDLLKACDSTLTACQQMSKDKDKVIEGQNNLVNAQSKQIEELTRKSESIFENKTFWFVMGALFTGTVYAMVKP